MSRMTPTGIGAVWRRNFLVWKKLSLASMVGNFGDPFLYLLGLGYGLGLFIGEMSGMPYMTFLATGIVCSSTMNTATFEGLYSAFTRMTQQGTWEGMLATPLTLKEIIAGEILWAASKGLLSAFAIVIVAGLLGAIQNWGMVWLALPSLLLVGLCFAALALTVCVLSPSYDFFLFYFTLVLTPMFLFCGVFYPIETLPDLLQSLTWLLPLTHAVALVRPLLSDLPLTQPLWHAGILAAYALAGFTLAVHLARRRLLR